MRASYPELDADTRWQRLMSKRFGGLCKPGQRRGDCLSLLDDVMGSSARRRESRKGDTPPRGHR